MGYAIAALGTVIVTATFVPVRDSLTPVSEAFAYLVLVTVAAWVGGFWPGVAASFLAFLTFNYYFLPPYNRWVIDSVEHIVVLFVLLGFSAVISTLLARTRERADAAEAREGELAALQELSRELVVRAPGKEALEAALSRLVRLLGYRAAALHVRDVEGTDDLNELVSVGTEPRTLAPVTTSAMSAPNTEHVPLSVGRHNLGILLLEGGRPPLSPRESRVLRAFCDQLAILLERDRLLGVAAKAETYRSAEKLRRALLTAVSHDLRSPLSAIKASVTDLLDEEAPIDVAYRRDALDSIDKEVDRLNLLIANLLDMSRIEAGMLRARPQSVDLREVITLNVDHATRRWPAAEFTVSVDERAGSVRADPVFLDRVITNLLDNAARSSLDAGEKKVEVQVRPQENAIAVRVIDHGKGLSPAAREHLFHPFYDLDQRSLRLGAGLGLAICRGFLSSMDGEIWVEETPGGGASLAFTLPRAAGP